MQRLFAFAWIPKALTMPLFHQEPSAGVMCPCCAERLLNSTSPSSLSWSAEFTNHYSMTDPIEAINALMYSCAVSPFAASLLALFASPAAFATNCALKKRGPRNWLAPPVYLFECFSSLVLFTSTNRDQTDRFLA